ncbi:hypothetical protein Ae201684P_005846 [Aphanomyces euteiches]|uniref:Histone chaperone RTT106/FACT complex subunit SPT16-like middle domain-containing protein n=1 Tax=Aphanomyces euteiches TaxID=100861 RepID=A0A6G0WWF8_9STRA|nr:hypothetical protein Ae201684_011112 [Aphanomyces euteiches]KAH9058503.1 hypothetical protein Ae201684P_005846 [Aphanomyces euteiches]KAH9136128.1 hypothetical protein AeRB84_018596 [Aphanomyces euteiches]
MTNLTAVKTFPEVDGKRYMSPQDGAPCIKCTCRGSSGVLFFLPEGLCFLDSPIFLRRQTLRSITWESSSMPRKFDVTVDMIDGMTIDFNMVAVDEIPVISSFVAYIGTLRDKDDEAKSKAIVNLAADEDEEDDDDEDDSDFEMNDEDELSDYDDEALSEDVDEEDIEMDFEQASEMQ